MKLFQLKLMLMFSIDNVWFCSCGEPLAAERVDAPIDGGDSASRTDDCAAADASIDAILDHCPSTRQLELFGRDDVIDPAAASATSRRDALLLGNAVQQPGVVDPLAVAVGIERHGASGVVATASVDVGQRKRPRKQQRKQQRRFRLSHLRTEGLRRRDGVGDVGDGVGAQFQLARAAVGHVVAARFAHDPLQFAGVDALPSRLFVGRVPGSSLSGL